MRCRSPNTSNTARTRRTSPAERCGRTIARPVAARLGLLLVRGVEITRPVPGVKSDWPVGSAHFNVLFPTDLDALDTPDLAEVLSRAKAQGAFVFWNHPGFMDKPAVWFPHVGALFDAGLFSGIEVVNGDRFYPEALAWSTQRHLTPLACSDAHQPMPAHLTSVDWPITLVFARTKDVDGLKEALVARRNAGLARQSGLGERDASDRIVETRRNRAPARATGAVLRNRGQQQRGDRMGNVRLFVSRRGRP